MINALTRDRESEPIASARKRSARVPAASGPAVTERVSAPGSVGPGAAERGWSVGALKVLVVLMGVLIVGGTVTLVALLVQRVGDASGGAAWQAALDQPEGARIGGLAAAGNAIGVWVQRADGDRVLILDPKRGRVTGEIRLGR